MLDFTETQNKKYIPILTFGLGVFIGGLLLHFWVQKKSQEEGHFSNGGDVAPAPAVAPAPVAPAPVAPQVVAPVAVAPAVVSPLNPA
jgi:hypothetical protein